MRPIIAAVILLFASILPACAEEAKPSTQLNIAGIIDVKEVEPAIFEVQVKLEGGAIAILHMNVFTLEKLRVRLDQIAYSEGGGGLRGK
jgi:hypothetical protein